MFPKLMLIVFTFFTEIIKLMIKKGTPRKRRKSPDAGHYL